MPGSIVCKVRAIKNFGAGHERSYSLPRSLPVTAATKGCCRYTRAPLCPYHGTVTVREIDPTYSSLLLMAEVPGGAGLDVETRVGTSVFRVYISRIVTMVLGRYLLLGQDKTLGETLRLDLQQGPVPISQICAFCLLILMASDY